MSPDDLTGGHPTVRRRVLVDGHVQAVGFRASCARRAVQAGLSGWVRNLGDGRVEAVFEGRPDAVDGLIAWCHEGPALARVTGVEVVEQPPLGDTRFGIR